MKKHGSGNRSGNFRKNKREHIHRAYAGKSIRQTSRNRHGWIGKDVDAVNQYAAVM